MKTSWKEKLETSGKKHGLPKIVKLKKKQEKIWEENNKWYLEIDELLFRKNRVVIELTHYDL